jgi:hypothetical protein
VAVLTPTQVGNIVKSLGPPGGTTAAEWVAKSRQESSHNTEATNGSHIGLYQINYKLHAGKGGLSSNQAEARTQLFDPFRNFAAAKAVYAEAGGWGPWNASGGRPTPNDRDTAGANEATGGNNVGLDDIPGLLDAVVSDPLEWLEAIAAPIKDFVEVVIAGGKWIVNPDNWIRIGLVIAGIGVVAIGGTALAKPVIEPAVKVATKGKL